MRKAAILLLATILALISFPVAAQQNVVIDSLEIDLWPEYDRPEMLVIYRIRLAEEVSLPAELRLRIPAAAGNPNAVAVLSAAGGLVNADYQRTVEGEWAVIALSADSPIVQVEHYDPGLQKDGERRDYTFRWTGDYAVNELTVQVQQPLGARGLEISPSLGTSEAGGDGLLYYEGQLGVLEQGTSFELTLSYEKASDALSISQLQPAAALEPQPAPAGAQNFDMTSLVPWALGVVGLGLIGLGVYRYWREAQGPPTRKKRSGGSRRGGRRAASSADAQGVFCHNCGTKSQAGDRYCRSCGTRLRTT